MTTPKKKTPAPRPVTREQLESELHQLRRWLEMLSREWIGEGGGLRTLEYTNRRPLTESEDVRASVITRAGYELARVLRETRLMGKLPDLTGR